MYRGSRKEEIEVSEAQLYYISPIGIKYSDESWEILEDFSRLKQRLTEDKPEPWPTPTFVSTTYKECPPLLLNQEEKSNKKEERKKREEGIEE